MQTLIAKPLLFKPTFDNQTYRLMFCKPKAVDALIGNEAPFRTAAEFAHRSKVRSELALMNRFASGLPWLEAGRRDDDRDMLGFYTQLAETALGRDPAQGPAHIIWDSAHNMRGGWQAYAHYFKDGVRSSADVSDLTALITDVPVKRAGIYNVVLTSTAGEALRPTLLGVTVTTERRSHRFSMRAHHETGTWEPTIPADAIHTALRRGRHIKDMAYDPASITADNLAAFMPAAEARATELLASHMPARPEALPPVTWEHTPARAAQ